MNKKLWFALIFVSLLDILTTKLFLSRGFIEGNQIARFLFEKTNFLLAAFFLKALLLSIIYSIRKYKYISVIMKTIIVVSALACVNNLIVYFFL